jgi:uncharacterized membrane protein YoaK (UPF0700 family)
VTSRDGAPPPISLAQLRRDAASVRHPLTRALLVLTFTTGLVDATSYLGLGHVFAANMTGNILLLGFGIAGAGGLPVVAPLISLAGFLAGAGLGGALDRRLAHRFDHGFRIAVVLEAAVMVAAVVIAAVVHVRVAHASGDLVIALLALGMGLRSATVRALGVPDVNTTVLTMTLTGLAAGAPWAGSDGSGSARRVAAVLAMLTGAVVGALLLKTSIALVLALAAGLAVGTLGAYRVLSPPAGARDAPGSGGEEPGPGGGPSLGG